MTTINTQPSKKHTQLSAIASKPKLVSLLLDDKETVKEFGGPLEFYTWDRQPLDVFMQLASADQTNREQMIRLVMPLLLDEEGNRIIQGEVTLKNKHLIASISKIVELLGN